MDSYLSWPPTPTHPMPPLRSARSSKCRLSSCAPHHEQAYLRNLIDVKSEDLGDLLTGHIEGKTYSITANGQRRAKNFVLKLTPADVRAMTAGMGLHAYATLDLEKGWRESAEWRDEMEAAGKADAFTFTADEVLSRFHPEPVSVAPPEDFDAQQDGA